MFDGRIDHRFHFLKINNVFFCFIFAYSNQLQNYKKSNGGFPQNCHNKFLLASYFIIHTHKVSFCWSTSLNFKDSWSYMCQIIKHHVFVCCKKHNIFCTWAEWGFENLTWIISILLRCILLSGILEESLIVSAPIMDESIESIKRIIHETSQFRLNWNELHSTLRNFQYKLIIMLLISVASKLLFFIEIINFQFTNLKSNIKTR